MADAKQTKTGQLIAADLQSAGFRETRQARKQELFEDYVELIDDLISARGQARQVEIAARLGVAQPTVAKMLKRLSDEGLAVQKPYRSVALTDLGQRLAAQARDRHRVVEAFLLALGVSPETARRDAEGIEHYVSAETLSAFRQFTDRRARER